MLPAAGAASAPAPQHRGAAAGVRVGLVTLGCDKNTVDSERLLAELLSAGARVSGEVAGADVVVVNTCGFIDVAKQESVDALLDALRLKEDGGVRAVVAVGCLVQRYKDELRQELPGLDLLLGTTEEARLIPELRARGVLPPAPPAGEGPVMERPLRVLSTSARHTSYLKISEGCDHGCAFCAIPLMRGKHRSTPIERLVREARELEAAGVVELNIVSQDTTWYGRDLARGGAAAAEDDYFAGKVFDGMAGVPHDTVGGCGSVGVLAGSPAASGIPADPRRGPDANNTPTPAVSHTPPTPHSHTGLSAPRDGLLPELLQALLHETTIPWLRLFYLYPSGITERLVDFIAGEPRILPYIDMPIQHGSDAVLKRMRRPERQATIRERVGWLRAAIPDVALRTTVIVGFPGEADEDFEAMLALLEELRFDHLGAFAYSVEEGTPAAAMPEQVPAALRRERLERVLELQRAIALEKNEARIGLETTVLVEQAARRGRSGLVGRTPWQAAELDGIVLLRAAAGGAAPPPPPRPGDFVRARIVEVSGAAEDDLVARIIRD